MAIGRAYEVTDGSTPAVRERDPDSLAILNTGPTINVGTGVGGILDRLFMSRGNSTLLELDPDTLATINSASPGINPQGIGGTLDQLFTAVIQTDSFEVDPDTLLLLDSGLAHGYTSGASMGMGGMADGQLFIGNQSGDGDFQRLAKLDSVTRFKSTPSLSAGNRHGVGGTNARLYNIDDTNNLFLEIDPETLSTINSIAAGDSFPSGAGGMKLVDGNSSRRLTTILSTPY